MNTHSTTRRVRLLAVAALAALALGGCGDDDDATTPSAATDAPPVTTTVAATTTATAAPARSTTTVPATDPPEPVTAEVAFETSNQQAAPLYNDPQVPSFAVSSDMSGDLVGSISSAVLNVPGSMIAESWFEGSVADCGTGGMALRIGTRPDGATGWEIVPGLGTGDLADVTGSGTEVPPKFEGTIACHGEPGFATTLLTPAPTDPGARECSVVTPAMTSQQGADVPMRPSMSQPARMRVEQSTAEGVTMWAIWLWPPDGQTTETLNAFAGVFLAAACGIDSVGRILIDDLLEPDFRGAWDLLPAVNAGAMGGGQIPGTGAVLVP